MKKEIRIAKFGGTPLSVPKALDQLLGILIEEKIDVVVVSAFSKTTTALRELVEGYRDLDQNLINGARDRVLKFNEPFIKKLNDSKIQSLKHFRDTIEFIEEILKKRSCNAWEMILDDVMGQGERISSPVISAYLNENDFPNEEVFTPRWLKTDMNFGEANFQREESLKNLKENRIIQRCIKEGVTVVAPGYIASSARNSPFGFHGFTTLGREGSDYTAIILASLLKELKFNIKEVILFKDVDGVANRNPKIRSKEPLFFRDRMSYAEAIKDTQKGGSADGLIYPKAVGLAEEWIIPIKIKNFWYPERPGTLIY